MADRSTRARATLGDRRVAEGLAAAAGERNSSVSRVTRNPWMGRQLGTWGWTHHHRTTYLAGAPSRRPVGHSCWLCVCTSADARNQLRDGRSSRASACSGRIAVVGREDAERERAVTMSNAKSPIRSRASSALTSLQTTQSQRRCSQSLRLRFCPLVISNTARAPLEQPRAATHFTDPRHVDRVTVCSGCYNFSSAI